jgi:hypothetical protein
MSSRDIQRVLQEKNVNTSLTTVRKAIDAAGFVSTKPRYCQLIRDINKAKRVHKSLRTLYHQRQEVLLLHVY